MEREPTELVELGRVTADTAGEDRTGVEGGGKYEPLGLTQD